MSSSRFVAANTATFSDPFPTVVEAAKAAGFSGLEVWKQDVESVPGGTAEVTDLLAGAGLGAPAFQLLRDYEGSGAGRSERLAEAEALMDMMVGIGAQTLLMCANTDPASSGDQEEHIIDLRLLADLAQARDLQIGFEPLAWSRWVNDYEKAWACIEAVDRASFGLVLDVFHLFSQGTSLKVLDRMSMNKLFLVQLSNAVTMPLPTIEIARHHRLFPSEGEWPVADAVQYVEKRGFQGDYSVEVFNDDYKKRDPFEVAEAAFLSFGKLFSSSQSGAMLDRLAMK